MNHFLFFYIITIPPYSIFVNRKTSFLTTSFNILLFWMLDVYILTNGKLYPRSIISLLIVLYLSVLKIYGMSPVFFPFQHIQQWFFPLYCIILLVLNFPSVKNQPQHLFLSLYHQHINYNDLYTSLHLCHLTLVHHNQ